MTADIKPEVIKRTQELLGKHIKKPPLTEKLLKKPPFRFLHDIVTSVIRGTGFLEGVLSPEEMNHENIKDKEGKIAFLQKIIDAVNSHSGIKLSVRPSKIVAGHEPNKTNELLQAIGKAIDGKRKNADSSGGTPSSQAVPAKKPSKISTQSSTPSKDMAPTGKPTATSKLEKSKSTTSTTQDRSRTKVTDKKKSSTKVTTEPKSKSTTQVKTIRKDDILPKQEEQSAVAGDFMGEKVDLDSKNIQESPADIADESVEANVIAEVQHEEGSSLPIQEVEIKRPQSAHLRQRPSTTNKNLDSNVELEKAKPKPEEDSEASNRGLESDLSKAKVPPKRPMSVRPPTARPASARPAAPRIRDRGDVPRTDEPAPLAGKVILISDNDTSKEQDEDEFLVIESKPTAVEEIKPANAQPLLQGPHGHLVAQILETQKDLEDDARLNTSNKAPAAKKTDIEWEGGRKREREAVKLEVEALRAVVQTTTSIVNPLGKLMDYVLEDVDSMQRELETWRDTNTRLTAQLREEERLTDQAVEPMKLHLEQLEESIKEKRDQISALKSTVFLNDNRIKRLLIGGVSKDF